MYVESTNRKGGTDEPSSRTEAGTQVQSLWTPRGKRGLRGYGRRGLTSVNTTETVNRGGNEGDPTVRTGSLTQRSAAIGVGRNSREEGAHVQLIHFAVRQNWHYRVKHTHANENSTVPRAHACSVINRPTH